MNIKDLIQRIEPSDPQALDAALAHWDSLAKPLGSLGVLESDITKICTLKQTDSPRLEKRTLFVICADNGVIAQGVSQSDESVTEAVAAALGEGISTVNYMADTAGCTVIPVDAGMKAENTPRGVLPMKIRRGTADMTTGPAMTREDCEDAILKGAELVHIEHVNGTDVILLGEMGIGNTTTSTAVASVLLDKSPGELAGRGAGLSDDGLKRKIRAIEAAISINHPDSSDPVDILSKVGGFDLAMLTGICLGAAVYRIPVILDGVITNTAALCAVRLCADTRNALIASHVSSEPAAELLLSALGLEPCINAGLHLGEGSGAVLALPLLDQAMAVYSSGHTFSHLGIDAYIHQN